MEKSIVRRETKWVFATEQGYVLGMFRGTSGEIDALTIGYPESGMVRCAPTKRRLLECGREQMERWNARHPMAIVSPARMRVTIEVERGGRGVSVRWCITEDLKNPAKGEEWHEAEDNLSAGEAVTNRVNELFPGVFKMKNCWHTMTEAGVVVDFGSHTFFGLIAKGAEE